MPVRVVFECLLDPRPGRLVFDGDGYLMPQHGQGWNGLVRGNHQAMSLERRNDPENYEDNQRGAHGISPIAPLPRNGTKTVRKLAREK